MEIKQYLLLLISVFFSINVFAGERQKVPDGNCDQYLFIKDGVNLLYIKNFRGNELFIMDSSTKENSPEFQEEFINFGIDIKFMESTNYAKITKKVESHCVVAIKDFSKENVTGNLCCVDGICDFLAPSNNLASNVTAVLGAMAATSTACGVATISSGGLQGAAVCAALTAGAGLVCNLPLMVESASAEEVMSDIPGTAEYSQAYPQEASLIDETLNQVFQEEYYQPPVAPPYIPPVAEPQPKASNVVSGCKNCRNAQQTGRRCFIHNPMPFFTSYY
ncbi:MAG: hypothetical protein HQK52_20385 [Oligoflexia bacterium]|nr:hypothetical protein [Oligoflexia bacterium]